MTAAEHANLSDHLQANTGDMEVKGQATYLDDSQVAVFGVSAQVEDVPFYIHGGWKNKTDLCVIN